jgi:uncharacterized protein YegJ (DUF2314 family)
MNRWLYLLGTAFLVCACALTSAKAEEQSPVINFSNGDPEMAAAKAKARATLAKFWSAYGNPGPGEERFALKVAVPVGGDNTEHIWVGDIERKSGRITGVVANVPRDARNLHAGERIEIAEDRISDWMFMRKGKIVGNETMRPALKRMPPDQAAYFRKMMAEP